MGRTRKLRLAVEYYGARAMVYFVALLPLGMALWLGRRFGDLARLVDRRHRERAENQVRERLGLDAEEARRFVVRNFRNYGMTAAEFAQLSRMRAADFAPLVDTEGFGQLCDSLLAEGKGLMIITAHFGNWEWCNSLATLLGYTGGSIARPLDNPRLNEFVRGVRERNGLRIFDKAGAIRKALAALRENKIVGILIDQDAGRQGLMSPFLGKPASTITIPVELAMRTGAPLITAGLMRGGPSGKRFTAVFNPRPFRADPDADPQAEVRRVIDALNEDLGRMIMRAPDQWFWIHRRWKTEDGRK